MTRAARFAAAGLLCLGMAASGTGWMRAGSAPASRPAALAGRVPASAVKSLGVLSRGFDERSAMDLVIFMDQFWRNAGNAGYNATIDRIRTRLRQSGFADREPGTAPAGGPRTWVEEYGRAQGWDYSAGTLTLLGGERGKDEVLLSREQQRVALCINSFSTPSGGLEAPIVDVGQGTDADFAKVEAKGAVVLGDASVGRLWQAAVIRRGALGVITPSMEAYVRPGSAAADAARPRSEWDVLQWGSIPYDETRRAFGFKATPKAAARIRERLKAGPARVQVEIASTFTPGPIRTLVAEIPGSVKPEERILLAAHIQEPGANDNSSGCASLVELARAIHDAVRTGKLAKPGRTLTFLWLDEIRGSRQWVTDHPAEAKLVRYMFSLDMTGEDPVKTGGPFLIEKMPDPSAVWSRPSDPHTEWGGGQYKADLLRGTLLNDLFLAICQRHARGTPWVVQTNPYEGGSDHSVFLGQGVPSVLAWHFPDWFYHTSLDRPDKTSTAEMKHVGASIAATALLLGGATDADARAVVSLIETAAVERLALEAQQGAQLIAKDADHTAAEARERQVRAAWIKWYTEALRETLSLPLASASAELKRDVENAIARLQRQ
jgi:aminopeptidase YwaD